LAGDLRTAGYDARAARDLEDALERAEVVVTCTSSTRAFVSEHHVKPGAFIAAVGADNEDKHEIAASLMAQSLVVVDDLEQCAAIGDLHHALAAGLVDRTHVSGTLLDVARSPERFAWRAERTVPAL
jgi:ornithine cyclodeaminase/alanine dehydrogenase-like protein (mu-crystallin family)